MQDTLVIGSRFDADASGASCRQAFYGRLVHLLDTADPKQLQQLRVFKLKQRRGLVERMSEDGTSAVCRSMFKKDTDISLFANLKVRSVMLCSQQEYREQHLGAFSSLWSSLLMQLEGLCTSLRCMNTEAEGRSS